MSETPDLKLLLDERAITQTIFNYANCIDRWDIAGIRACLADDIVAQYGNSDQLHGADAVMGFIVPATESVARQHHLLTPHEIVVDGDTATAFIYHTSHQILFDEENVVAVIVGRYHNTLVRTGGKWLINSLVFEIVWAERRVDTFEYLTALGGPGPNMVQNRAPRQS